MKPSRPKLILVKWQDCETLDGWHDVPTLLEFAGQPRIIYTTGFVIDDDESRMVLSSSWETTFGKIAGGWIIPKKQIISWHVLKTETREETDEATNRKFDDGSPCGVEVRE